MDNIALNWHGRRRGRDCSHRWRPWQGHSPARSETAPVRKRIFCYLVAFSDEQTPVGEDLVGAIESQSDAQQGRAHHLAPHHLEISVHSRIKIQLPSLHLTLEVAQSVTVVTRGQFWPDLVFHFQLNATACSSSSVPSYSWMPCNAIVFDLP